MKKYLVQDNRIVGDACNMHGEPPQGFSIYESEDDYLLGCILVDDAPAAEIPTPEVPMATSIAPEPIVFWGTDLFKKARIRGNKDPYLATQMGLAMVAEQRGDTVILKGALKSIEDILRKHYG